MTLKRLLFNRYTIAVASAVLAVLISFPLYRQTKQRAAVADEIRKLQLEISASERKNDELRKMIEYLKSDQFAEEQARLQLGFKREGEDVFAVKQQEDSSGPSPSDRPGSADETNASPGKNQKNPGKWLDYFLNKKI